MEDIIRPDKRLLTKSWYILLTISLLILMVVLVLQIFIPLGKEVTSDELARVLWPITGGAVLALWVISVPIIILWIRNLKYVIGEEKVTIHKGVLTKVQKNIPYRAVTDFILHRSLYDRFLGIASIRIQTAGQSQTATGYEGNIAGLIAWDDLHMRLRDKIKKLHPVSESLGTKETISSRPETQLLEQILEELREIRKVLDR